MDPSTNFVTPRPGSISQDRVAIFGTRGASDLFLGSNDYYLQYWEPSRPELVQSFVDWAVGFQTGCLSVASAAFLMFVPNKLSCLPENYPLFVPRSTSPVFSGLREILDPYKSTCFFPWMTEGPYAAREQYWFKHDSHWSSLGAEAASRWLLESLGVASDRPVLERRESHYGDLAGRWSGQHPLLQDLAHRELDEDRNCVNDNADGALYSANTGRMVEWRGGSGTVDGSILIVGDSFSGAGYSPWNLTYWLSHYFAKTTFFHSFHLPGDLVGRIQPDFVVYQSNERFLRHPPIESEPMDVVLENYRERAQRPAT